MNATVDVKISGHAVSILLTGILTLQASNHLSYRSLTTLSPPCQERAKLNGEATKCTSWQYFCLILLHRTSNMLVNESSMTPVSTLWVFSDKAPSCHGAVINHTDCDCGQIPDSQVMRWLLCYKLCVVLLCHNDEKRWPPISGKPCHVFKGLWCRLRELVVKDKCWPQEIYNQEAK